MTEDSQLLRRYTEGRAESAFGELVARHIDLVYSAALRVVGGDRHLAQDVTQTVFADLARKAGSLPRAVVLAGWLYRHTCFTAAKAVRAEQRRRIREKTAMEMIALQDNTEPTWEQIAPVLDEAMNQLSASERDAVVLRFLKRQDLRAVGSALGVGEDAAQKRVGRALEKLRTFLSRRGVTLTATTLATTLATEAVVAAPTGLAVSVTATSLAGAAVGTGIRATLLKLMATTKLKAGITSAIVVASVVTPLVLQHLTQARLRDQDGALRQRADQLAMLQAANEQLSKLLASAENSRPLSNEQLSELMRLRGESGRLQTTVQELTGTKTNAPLSREEVLASIRQMYMDRVNRLKQQFTANPAEAVPELQYVTDRQWLELVEYDHHRIDPDNSRVMSSARSGSQIRFGMSILNDALEQYGKNNGGRFPTDLSQLAPYFKSPVDDSVLANWTILPTSSLPSGMRVDEDSVITQKAPVNAELDQRVVIGMKTSSLGQGGTNDWVRVP